MLEIKRSRNGLNKQELFDGLTSENKV